MKPACDPNPHYICSLCKVEKENMSTCSKCKIVLYCSKECQTNDWEKHKVSCGTEQRKYGIKTTQAANILTQNESFIKIMSSICHLHYNTKEKLILSLLETGFAEWGCIVDSYPLEGNETNVMPKGQYGFGFICLSEKNVDTHNTLCLGIPINICKKNCKELFGSSKIALPIKLQISHDIVIVRDSSDNIIKVLK